jgi:acyl-CoA reductase-like NAD-dependent aldehyde dehydrogenase
MSNKVYKISNFINNIHISSENHIESFNPSNGQVVALLPDTDAKEADTAVEVKPIFFFNLKI